MNITTFIHATHWEDLSPAVQAQTTRCLLDTLGAGIGGRATDTARIIHDFAATCLGGGDALLWQDGRRTSPAGAALANGATIDSLDIHDGFLLCKGHAGAAVVPAALASVGLGAGPMTGRELLTSLAIGYEIALRAGMCLHATAADYHSSGSWNALGCAAVVARRLRLSAEQTLAALAIAEYHGPRSPIMRCVAHPTMLKDGCGWGALVGVTAAQLAGLGFTGRPADTVETAAAQPYCDRLGEDWHFLRLYFKPHAVCRWAQPAVEAVLQLQSEHGIAADAIAAIRITTFHEAVCLATRRPRTSDEAQYSLPFSVAAALAHGTLGPDQLTGPALVDSRVLRLIGRLEFQECPDLSARFPARRFAHATITTTDGRSFEARDVEARWDAGAPPSDAELAEKFRWLAQKLPTERGRSLERTILGCAALADAWQLLELLAEP
jgi:2-methylcitrate dehydratase PrpD